MWLEIKRGAVEMTDYKEIGKAMEESGYRFFGVRAGKPKKVGQYCACSWHEDDFRIIAFPELRQPELKKSMTTRILEKSRKKLKKHWKFTKNGATLKPNPCMSLAAIIWNMGTITANT